MDKECDDNIISKELNTVLQFSTLINSSLQIESVLDTAMKCAEEFINAEASTIYERDEENAEELFIRLARGEKKEPVKNIRVKVGDGIAGYVVKTGKPMVINDVHKEKRFDEKYDRLTGFRTRSLICVPLILRGNATGAIQVLNKISGDSFTGHDLEILTSLSQQIAVAMENARLYQRLEEKFRMTSTELAQAQEKLIRTERIAAMGNLVNGIAHEIRNPITVIGGFARRIKRLSEDRPEFINYSDIILGETARLERLVKQVHKLAEVQTATLHPVNIFRILNDSIDAFKPASLEKGIEIKADLKEDLPLVSLDETQMFTALTNIFENAIESMEPGGKLLIDTGLIENTVTINIKDSGSGIDEKDLDSVYDPFVTSKTRGAGLGLTMVYQIIKNHNGDISIKSPGKAGTIVLIKLPVFLRNTLIRE